MLARMSAVLLHEGKATFGASAASTYATPATLDESTATLIAATRAESTYRVSVEGSTSALSNGNYSYDLRRIDQSRPIVLHVPWRKTSSRCIVDVPGPGLYEIIIRDTLEVPRIDLMLAVIQPKQRHMGEDFLRAKKLLEAWNGESYGWPVHPLLRAYLRSLFGPA
jgi:hypothetical protein